MATLNEIFGRINEFGTVDVLYIADGEPATCITDAPEHIKNIRHTFVCGGKILEVSGSVRYQSDKIIISIADAQKIGLEIEG